MQFDPIFIASIIAMVVALASSAITSRVSASRRREYEKRRMEVMQLYEEALSLRLGGYRKLYSEKNLNDVWNSLLQESASASSSSPISLLSMSKKEIQKEIDGRVQSLKVRMENIEKRFPEQSIIDKIASVNDAILATQIENLSKSVQQLEEKLLTRWDVAKIVFQIMAALSGLIGVILALIKFVGNMAGL